ncbi:MAG: hypothetical protein J6T64_03650 [Bacteroidaceae bacterium]|nr:hypothetical protein [Bacteroidaceae bacterium]
MKTNEETTVLNDATRVARDEKTVYQKNEKSSTQLEELSFENGVKPTWKTVTISGVSGIALGAAGVLFSGATLPEKEITNQLAGEVAELSEGEEKEEDATVETEPQETSGESHTININIEGGDKIESINVQESEGSNVTVNIHLAESQGPADAPNSGNIIFATGVNDNMSFGEAFAAARHEVGAGGAFVWHGTVYGTYYANEWSQMSAAEKNQFTSDAINTYHSGSSHSHYAESQAAHEPSVAPDVHTTSQSDDLASVDVHVLGVDHNVDVGDGSVVDLGYAYLDGHAAMFIDVDQDGTFDAAAIDLNDNGKIEEGEFGELNPDLGMTVEGFEQAAEMQSGSAVDDLYADSPDYINDADVSCLA